MSDDLLRKIATLERWKSDALSVMPPLEEIAKELNVPLGVPIYDKILPGIQKLKADLAELQAMILKFKRAFDIAKTFNDDAPAAEIALSASFHEAMQHDVLDVLEARVKALESILERVMGDWAEGCKHTEVTTWDEAAQLLMTK